MQASKIKQEIRKRVWDFMEKNNMATFPRPVYNRIPNFVDSDKACLKISELDIFKKSKVIKVNPDAPQRKIREIILKEGKTLVFATPRLKEGFLIIDGSKINSSEIRTASTIKGAFYYGKKLHPSELPVVDLIISGSVAVTKNGERIGKGEGYSELEFAILLHYKKIDKNITIITSVHESQIVDFIPLEPFDVTVDIITTPTNVIKVERRAERPNGILWEFLSSDKIEEIPLLKELKFQNYS
jgi:5-formyltetrahydrofolate cyclo-ligase